MKKKFLIILLVLVLLPLNCYALTQYEDNDSNFIYQIDDETWEELDEINQGIFSIKRWKGNCGLLGIMKTDMYAELLKKDSTSNISRGSLNYKNNFKYMADSFISGLNQNETYDLNHWEYYDSNKVKFAKFSGVYKESDLLYDMGGYFTFNNGYAFVIIYIKDASANQVICDNSFIRVVNSINPKTEQKKINNSKSSLLSKILAAIILTTLCSVGGIIAYKKKNKTIKEENVNNKSKSNSNVSQIIGIILLVLQVMAYYGADGLSYFNRIASADSSNIIFVLGEFIGFNLIGIIGIILLFCSRKKKNKNKEKIVEGNNKKEEKANNRIKESNIEVKKKSKIKFKCDNCGAIVSEDTDKCPSCHVKFTNEEEIVKNKNEKTGLFKCDNCGAIVKESETKCPECGESFEDDNNNIDKKYSDLNKLKELLDNKIITKEEFDREKKKILK